MPIRCRVHSAWLLASAACFLLANGRSAEPFTTSPYFVDSWSSKEGLPQSSVIALVKSHEGYLWLGTLRGLVRFDGVKFSVFDESNTRGLPSSKVVKLFEDSRRNFWIGTESEGVVMVKPDGELQVAPLRRGTPDGRLVSICEDASGTVWLCTADGQLWRHRDGQFQAAAMPGAHSVIAEAGGRLWIGAGPGQLGLPITAATGGPTNQVFIPATRLDLLLQSSRGGYWRIADGRIQRWEGEKSVEDLGGYPWGGARVTAACEDRSGNLVVGTFDGVYWFSDGQVHRISKNEGLSHNAVLSLGVDGEGNLWVGTDSGGLNRVRRRLFNAPAESFFIQPGGSTVGVVQSLAENAEGGLWIGFNFYGLRYWRGNFVKDFETADGLINPNISATFVDRNQRVWVGTRGGEVSGLFTLQESRFQRLGGEPALQQSITAIHEDRAGRLWFGGEAGLVRLEENRWRTFTRRDGLSAERVSAIADDVAGNLWIGTEGGGLNRMRDGRFEVYRKSDAGLPSDNVSALQVDAQNTLWVGTSAGLARLQEGRWTRFTTEQGLPSNGIAYLIEDDEGYMWIGTSAGLVRVLKRGLDECATNPTNQFKLRVYTEADGLMSRECTVGSQPAACRTRDGRLLLPTIAGFIEVNPGAVKSNSFAPPVLIESVRVDGRAQSPESIRNVLPKTITLPLGRHSLELHYTSLNLGAPERTVFRHRMEGLEEFWNEVGTRRDRVASYPKLPVGKYRFVVQAANEDGVWNETGASLAIVVPPPFWQKRTFLVVASLALLGLIVGGVHLISTARLRRQMRQQAAVEKDRARIARDLHDQVGASMTQISLLAEMVEADKDAPEEVEAHAQQMIQSARQTTHVLDEIVWAVNPANDTLSGLINYICKNAQDYLHVAGFKYRFDVPPELPATPLSPEVRHNVFLAAKEAVTNVVRHSKGTSAWVRLRLDTTSFTLEIADDGVGMKDTAHATTRNGLRNMQKRMEDVGGKYAAGRAPEGGALITLIAPIVKREL